VTVLGGTRLCDDDPVVVACEEMARQLAQAGVPTRASAPGPLSVALARGGHRGARHLPQQAFGMRRENARNLYGADRVHLVNDRLTHKVLLTEGSLAVVALPGGLGTLDELFSVLCQLQTQTIAPRRIVLFGVEFWQPLCSVLKAQMLDGPRQTISPEDLSLVTITDDPGTAARLCLEPAPSSPPR
jgi:predicted Rossmann-fold nucleotide-binding protein